MGDVALFVRWCAGVRVCRGRGRERGRGRGRGCGRVGVWVGQGRAGHSEQSLFIYISPMNYSHFCWEGLLYSVN